MNKTIIFLSVLIAVSMIVLSAGASSATRAASFAQETSSGLPDSGEYNYADIGDINNDGNPDIVMAAGGYTSITVHGIYAYLGDGKGKFTKSGTGLTTDGNYGAASLGDVNKDGNLDILAGHDHWSGSDPDGILLYIGDGKGAFTLGTSPYTAEYASQIVVIDVNKDGNPDICAATQSEGIKVWLGDGSGSSWTESSTGLPSFSEYCGLAVGDIDGDGNLDMAATDYKSGGVTLYKGDGKGSWTDKGKITGTKGNMFGVAIVDFTGDSKMDIIACTQNTGIVSFKGDGAWGWTVWGTGLPKTGAYGEIEFADLNSDSKLDFVTACSDGGIKLFLGSTTGFSEVTDGGLPTDNTYYGATFSDVDKDGDQDIIGSTWGNGITEWKTNGVPVVTPPDDDVTPDDDTDDDTNVTDDDVVTPDDDTDDDTHASLGISALYVLACFLITAAIVLRRRK